MRTGSPCDLICRLALTAEMRKLAGFISKSWIGRVSPAVTDLLSPLGVNNVLHYSLPAETVFGQFDDCFLENNTRK